MPFPYSFPFHFDALGIRRKHRLGIEIRLYDDNLSSPTFTENLTDKVERLKFSTKLHGGFNICNFRLKADLPEAWEWLTKRVYYRIVIADVKRTLWEGRIEDIGMTVGYVEIIAFGYYSSLNDQIYKTAYDDNADVVIKAILTAACPDISSDQSNIEATDVAIDSAADTSYLDISCRKIVEKLLAFGDSSGNQWYFAIWENRIPYMAARSVSTVDWTVKMGAGDLKKFKLKHSSAELWNKVYAIYTAAGALTRTTDAEDTTSQTKYGVTRYYAVSQLGAVAQATAEAYRDRWLAEHKDIYPTFEEIILGDTVYDTGGAVYPSSWVRAGDIIRILDLVPATGDLDAVTRDALRTFYILETEYDIERKENRIIVDTENANISAILAREL